MKKPEKKKFTMDERPGRPLKLFPRLEHTKKILKIRLSGERAPIASYIYNRPANHAQINREVERLRKNLLLILPKNKTASLQIIVYGPDGSPISTPFKSINEKIKLPSFADSFHHIPDGYKFEKWYISQATYNKDNPNGFNFGRGRPKVGSNESNSCFWECLQEVLQDKNPWKSDKELKQEFKLKESDRLPLTLKVCQRIDEKLPKKYSLFICGQFLYESNKDTEFKVCLYAMNDHITVDQKLKPLVTTNLICTSPKYPKMYMKTGYDYLLYDGSDYDYMNPQEFKEAFNNPNNNNFILVSYREMVKCLQKEELKKIPIEEAYSRVRQMRNNLLKFDPDLDFFKFGSFSKMAVYLFDKTVKHIHPEVLTPAESEIIYFSMIGPLIYSEEYSGFAYSADFKSFYPGILTDKTFMFPVKQGQLKTLTEDEFLAYEFLPFGLYRVNIERSQFKKIRVLFRYNQHSDFYTHTDIRVARSLNLNVTLICDEEPNALIYQRSDCLTGSQVFAPFVNKVFKIKNKKVFGANPILQSLWGILCQKNKIVMWAMQNNKEIVVFPDNRIEKIEVHGDDALLKMVNKAKAFKTNWARLGPFLLAKGRERMAKKIMNYADDVVRLHTDGVITKNKMDVGYGENIGDLVYKGSCDDFWVKNINNFKKNAFKN